MPRKKATRANATQLKTSDPDASMVADGKDKLLLKKEAVIRDFHIMLNTHRTCMKNELKNRLDEVVRFFNVETMNVPKHIMKMTLKEFLAKGGDPLLLELNEIADVVDANVSFSVSCQDEGAPLVTPAARTTRKRVAPSSLAQSEIAPPRTLRGRPARKIQPGRDLPSVTPKFDPRQPITTARKARLGETLISLDGSPVIGPQRHSSEHENLLSLALNRQQTLLGGSIFDSTSVMSPNTLITSRERLQEAMDAINSKLSEITQAVDSSS